MNKKYDVIIIGAGPAGLKCAETFKGSKMSVLVIEKNKVIGPKVCAGGLTNFGKYLDLSKDDLRSFEKQIYYISKKRYEVDLVKHLSVIDRSRLGQIMLSKIKNCSNITVLTGTIATKIEKNKVITNNGEFSFNYLVGADGATSIVRNFLKLKTKYFIGLLYEIPKFSKELEIFFDGQKTKGGYIWNFPHRNHSNIGIYFNPRELDTIKARKLLENFLEENNIDYSNCKLEGAPLSVLYKGCIFENIFLVGGAAGLTSMTSGEGIVPAIVSGSEIAKKIIDPKYKLKEIKDVLYVKKIQEIFKIISDLFYPLRNLFLKLFVYLMKKKKIQKFFI